MGLFWTDEPLRARKEDDATRVLRPTRVVDSDWCRPTVLPELDGMVALDFETCDPGIQLGTGSSWPFASEGYVCGIAVACATLPHGLYVPLRHEGGGNMENEAVVWEWLGAQVSKPTVTLIMANAAYDLGWLWRNGITPHNIPYDVLALAALHNENEKSYSLDAVGKRFNMGGKDERLLYEAGLSMGLTNVKANLHRMPASYVGQYAEADAALTLRLYEPLMAEMRQQSLMQIVELEREVALVAWHMRRVGVRVDLDKAALVAKDFEAKEKECIASIRTWTAINVDVWDAVSIDLALREEGAIDIPRNRDGRPSIRKEWLAALDTPVARAVYDARRYNKARKTFVESYVLGHHRNGRIHAEFNALRREDDDGEGFGTVSGRFSSSSPNLQNIPRRDKEIRAAVRTLFLPEPGCVWLKGDYASQEPRLTVHYAGRIDLPGAGDMVDRFNADPRLDLHQETAVRMGIDRDTAKTINLGIAYGMQAGKLCKQLGLPYTQKIWKGREILVPGFEGEQLFAKQKTAVPFISQLFDIAKNRAASNGYIVSLWGRRCRFVRFDDGLPAYTHKALNRLIQSSAATQTKAGMNMVYDMGVIPLVSVHDELGFSIPKGDTALVKRLCEAMEQAIPLSVPFVVEPTVGDNWGVV